jgi:hypothetical protein
MAESEASFDIPVQIGPAAYLVRCWDQEMRIGKQAGEVMLWQDESIPVDSLPPRARAALERGDDQSTDLQLALEAIVEAVAQRGG